MFTDKKVEAVFQLYPPEVKEKLLFLRELIFDVAKKTEGVGRLTETLKWGQPSYVTVESKSGSTVRIDQIKTGKHKSEGCYAIFFHCQTSLIETFKTLFPGQFKYIGHRSIYFDLNDEIPVKELGYCIELALTYHLNKKP